MKLDLPPHFKVHHVIYVIHATPYYEQPKDISYLFTARSDPVPSVEGDGYTGKNKLDHRKNKKEYQFRTIMAGELEADAAWQLASGSVDNDGTVIDIRQECVRQNGILPPKQLRWTSIAKGGESVTIQMIFSTGCSYG